MTATTALQDRLTATVLANPSVHTIYPPRPTLGEIGSRLVTAAIEHDNRPPSVTVSEAGDGTAVTVSVGVTRELPATTVCRTLHDSLTAELEAARVRSPLSITVKIASIT